jgi:PAS domain-containing protein
MTTRVDGTTVIAGNKDDPKKITEQIDELRDVLAAASIRFKPDKFSTLISVVDYVKQLQARSTMLDMEHKKLIDTISRTNEMVNESYLPSSAGGGGGGGSIFSNDKIGSDLFLTAQPDSTVSSSGRHDIYNDDELVFVRNVDYRCIFDRCGMPLAVASIDGRLLDCNEEFVKLTGYEHKELLPNKHQKQQTSAPIIADHVASTSSAYPDVPVSHSDSNIITATNSITEGKRSPPEQDHNSVQDDNIVDDETVDENQAPAINFSLFDLLNRNHMEEVFMSLSEMLKRPPREKVGPEAIIVDDHWWGNVYLNRSSQVEMRMTISLVRSPQGRAKFFDCSLTPLAV